MSAYTVSYKNFGDKNFFNGGFLLAEEEPGRYYFIKCEPSYDDEDTYLFSEGYIDINDDWIDRDAVERFAGCNKDTEPEWYADACIDYYGPENFGANPEWLSGYEVLNAIDSYFLPEDIDFNGYSLKDAKLVYSEQRNKKDLLERALGDVNNVVRNNFNDLKEILENDDDYEMVNGIYYPRKAIAWVETADSYQDFHLNSNMDLTVSNILSAVEDFDSPEEYIEDLFDEYRPDSAYSWADNFIEVLKHLSSSDRWSGDDWANDEW